MDITWILGHLLAIGIGLSLGLIGGGGSILAVPILVYVMGLSAREGDRRESLYCRSSQSHRTDSPC